jgi:hydrogenase expression/formation protein HypC
MRITAIDGALATIVAEGLEQHASLALVPEAAVGDHVLVHAGYAITVLDAEEAEERMRLFAELGEFEAGERDRELDRDDGPLG